MVLPLLGLGIGMMAAGTAANMYGTAQRDRAQKNAMKAYQQAANQRANQEQKAMGQEAGALHGLVMDRQAGVGQYITGLGMAEKENAADSQQFRQGQQGALTDIGKLTGGAQSAYSYQGSPRTSSETQQAGITGQNNSRVAEAMLADHQLRAIQERQTQQGFTKTHADLLRQGKGKTTKERFALAKALRDLDWQRKTAALQGQLDEAGRKGQWANILGGLGTQAGGMMAMAGAGGGAEGPAAMGGTGAYDATSAGALDINAGPVGGGAFA